jgi:hypothetical protein
VAYYEKGYQGNFSIRGPGRPIALTDEQQQEYARCAQEPEYFIRNYVRIKFVDSEELVLFEPRPYQSEMVHKMLTERFVIVKLPRQAGKTSIVAATLLWHVIFNLNFSIMIAAHVGDKAREVLLSIKLMYEELPEWLQHGVKKWNDGRIELETGSRIKAGSTTARSARGDTYNLVYMDEFAFVETHIADEFVKSVIPTVSSGKTTKIFITSTPRGLNMFHDMWQAAKSGASGYAWVEIKWNDVPGRDEKFKKEIISQFGKTFFDQEFGAEFLGSSLTLISSNKLIAMVDELAPPISQSDELRVYARPIPGHHYTLTVDVSEGLGQDATCAMIVDVTDLPYTIAAVYQNSYIDPMSLPQVLASLGQRYNHAAILVESNFAGQVANILHHEMEYDNVVSTTRSAKGGDKIGGGFAPTSRRGVVMNQVVKRLGCNNLKTLVENNQLLVQDRPTYEELCRFAVDGKTYKAEAGHDDLVMCLVMFAWMADQGYIREQTDVNVRARIAEMNERAAWDSLAPIAFSDGSEDEGEGIDLYRPVQYVPPTEEIPLAQRHDLLFDKQTARAGKSEAQLGDIFAASMMSDPFSDG